MRRMQPAVLAVVAVIALVTLTAAGVALAASLNSYTGTVITRQNSAGTAAKPVALGLALRLGVLPATAADANADPLTEIKLTLAEVGFDVTDLPICSASRIAREQSDSGCPPGALVARGRMTAALWSPAATTQAGTPCDPVLDVWNSGRGRVTNFVEIPGGHSCSGLQPGAIPPWTATVAESGSTLTYDNPLPPLVSTDVGDLGLYASLRAETLTFPRQTRMVGPKRVSFLQSLGCVSHRHAYTASFTATDGSTEQTSTVSGSARC